jgi:hypothetical protein
MRKPESGSTKRIIPLTKAIRGDAAKINTTVSVLQFFFKVTLDRPDLSRHLSTIHRPRKRLT